MSSKVKTVIYTCVIMIIFGGMSLAAAADQITIGWTPPDITGVFKTATDYFEKGAKDAAAHGIKVKVIS